MTDQNPAPTTAPVEAPEAPEQTTGQQAEGKGQDDFNAARARRQLKQLQKQNEELAARLAKREEAEKSEMDKAIEAARKEGRSEVEAELAKIRMDHALETELLKRGLDPDLKHIVMAKGEITDVDEIATAVDEVLGEREWLRPKAAQGSQGAPTRNTQSAEFPRGGVWDAAQIREIRQRGEWSKYKDSILDWQRRA